MITHKVVIADHSTAMRYKRLLKDPNIYCFLIGVSLLVGINVLFSAI